MPERIKLSRKKGWRKPEGAVVVARPTKWGNPFAVGGEYVTVGFGGSELGILAIRSRVEAAGAFFNWLQGEFTVPEFEERRTWLLENLHELADKDVACWCPLGPVRIDDVSFAQCHGDVYLDLANGDEVPDA